MSEFDMPSFEELQAVERAKIDSSAEAHVQETSSAAQARQTAARERQRLQSQRAYFTEMLASKALEVSTELGLAGILPDITIQVIRTRFLNQGRFRRFSDVRTRIIGQHPGWVLTQELTHPGHGGSDKSGPWQNPDNYHGYALTAAGTIMDYSLLLNGLNVPTEDNGKYIHHETLSEQPIVGNNQIGPDGYIDSGILQGLARLSVLTEKG